MSTKRLLTYFKSRRQLGLGDRGDHWEECSWEPKQQAEWETHMELVKNILNTREHIERRKH